MLRCPGCRTRFALFTSLKKHIDATGHALCDCGGYHFKHRPGSPLCKKNPMAPYNHAAAQGASIEELEDIEMDIVFFGEGKPLTRWPFD